MTLPAILLRDLGYKRPYVLMDLGDNGKVEPISLDYGNKRYDFHKIEGNCLNKRIILKLLKHFNSREPVLYLTRQSTRSSSSLLVKPAFFKC